MFVQDIGDFIGLNHIVRIAIGPQAGQDAAVDHVHRRRAATGIAHVRFRIVDDHRIRRLDEVHFVGIDVDAVAEQGLGP